MSHDTSNRLVRVSEDLFRQSLSFAYNDNGLIERFDSANRQVGFVYDTSQNLIEITDVNGYKTNYTYNADGQVTLVRRMEPKYLAIPMTIREADLPKGR